MQAMKKSKLKLSREDKIYYAVCYTIIILLSLIVLYPMIYVVSASVSSGTALMAGEVWLFPKDITFLGYKTIFWSFAYADWDNQRQPTPEQAKEKILSNLHNGAVILLHPTSATNAAVLGDIITQLKADGWRFGSLDELTAAEAK